MTFFDIFSHEKKRKLLFLTVYPDEGRLYIFVLKITAKWVRETKYLQKFPKKVNVKFTSRDLDPDPHPQLDKMLDPDPARIN